MDGWGAGYVTDIEYTDGFYSAQSPTNLALAATINGIEAPDLEGAFSYCELGCGRGNTSMVLAAVHPQAEFHAIDFHPAHIAYAQVQARAAGLSNLTFHECSFDDLTGPRGATLPMFDVVTMHGVWSWIAPQLQQSILAFLNARLKPGGLVYVSYNAMPAWNAVAPLQRIVRELAGVGGQRSDVAVQHALQQVERFTKLKVIPERFQEDVKRLKDTAQNNLLSYLAHEYLNAHWQPLYHLDVARVFASAKLTFAGNSDLLKNFYNLYLTQEQRDAVAEIPVTELRETLKDFCTDHWFRQDIFVRGVRRMPDARREKLLSAQSLMLLRPPPDVIEIGRPDGSKWRPDVDVYRRVASALQQRPRRVSELLTLEGLPQDHQVRPVELVGILVGTGLAGIYREPSAAEHASAGKLNAPRHAEEEISLSSAVTLAVPAARGGVSISAANYPLYKALRRGETPRASALAESFIARCRAGGGHPVIDDKEIQDTAEAQAAARGDYAMKIERLVPIWRMMGLI
jgi:cyclopropane fatty-acyl-phospholipid synthase-like methyltransferase